MNTNFDNKHIIKVVITGGPCAGKTSALNTLINHFSPDFRVYAIPEAATMTFNSGFTIVQKESTKENNKTFNKSIIQFQMDMEKYFESLASYSEKRVLLLCDRGVCDNFIYCMEDNAKKIVKETGWSKNYLLNDRYDLVLHLVTAANGAEEYYTLDNNAARSESKEEAIILDKKLQEAWMAHPNFEIIDNSEKGFQNKLNKVINSIRRLVNLPSDFSYVRKFLLSDKEEFNIPEEFNSEVYSEKIDFLISNENDKIFSVIKREAEGYTSFSHITRAIQKSNEERLELRRTINEKNYYDFLRTKNPDCNSLNKQVTVFIYNSKIMNIEKTCIEDGELNNKVIRILRVFTNIKEEREVVPKFIKIEKEVTEDENFSSIKLASM